MSKLLISILLPVKNAALYLEACIDSIIGQSEQSWELIAVDDYSDDNSYTVLKQYEQQDSRIKVFKNQDKGIIPALRMAYSQSQGTLITRMDADDIMVSDKLEKLKTHLLEFGTGHIATGLVEYFSEGILGNGYLNYQNWLNGLSLQENNYSAIYKECVIPSPCWMVFREDLDRCGAFTPETYPEDYDLCFRFYKNNLKVKTVSTVLHQWRDYAERTSRNDPHYSDVHFFHLKIKYFLELDYRPNKQLLLWGTGKKGKKIAKILLERNILFRWITDNPKKIGKAIYTMKIESTALLENQFPIQVIIAIAAIKDLQEINQTLNQLKLLKNEDFFLFC